MGQEVFRGKEVREVGHEIVQGRLKLDQAGLDDVCKVGNGDQVLCR